MMSFPPLLVLPFAPKFLPARALRHTIYSRIGHITAGDRRRYFQFVVT
jgi:hypothetical protein